MKIYAWHLDMSVSYRNNLHNIKYLYIKNGVVFFNENTAILFDIISIQAY